MLRWLISPLLRPMQALNFTQKFVLIGLVFFAPLALMSALFVWDLSDQMAQTERETHSLQMAVTLRHWVDDLQKHRGMTGGYLSGKQAFKPKILALRQEIEQQRRAFSQLDDTFGESLDTRERWRGIQADWQALQAEAFGLTPPESFKRHTALIGESIALIQYAGVTSGLRKDADPTAFNLASHLVDRLLSQTEKMGMSRARGTALLASGASLSTGQIADMMTFSRMTRDLLNESQQTLQALFLASPQLKAALAPTGDAMSAASKAYLTTLDTNLLVADRAGRITPEAYFDQATRAIDSVYALYDQETPLLEAILSGRLQTLGAQRLWLIAGVAFVLMTIAALFTAFYFGVMDNLKALLGASAAMAQGDLTARLTIHSRDELGQFMQGFNAMADSFATLIRQIKQDADSVSGAANGLCASATQLQQTAQSLTSLAQSASHDTEQLDGTMREVTTSAGASSQSAQSMLESTRHVESSNAAVKSGAKDVSVAIQAITANTRGVSSAVNSVAAAIEEMSSTINEIAKNASQAAGVVREAEAQAEVSRSSVNTLGRSASEIGSIVDVIKSIAAQTNLLALNATIEAASAGDAGKGFAVVANEVKELAKQSAGASEDIHRRIADMQANTTQAVQAIEQIYQVISQMNHLTLTISSAVEEQSVTANEISRSIVEAANGSSQVSEAMDSTSRSTQTMAEQLEAAHTDIQQITRNLGVMSQGVNTIAASIGEASSGTSRMAHSVTQVSRSSQETDQCAVGIRRAADELTGLSTKLRDMVAQFKA